MKLYSGSKQVHARPMNRGEYNAYRGWEVPADENPADEGYLVEYVDGGKSNHPAHAGYISWSPKDVFERAYQPLAVEDVRFPIGQAPRVAIEDVLAEISGETYTVLPSGRVTICELTLKNGFTVRGESAVVFAENNVPELGRKYAREKAVDQIWQLLGFRLREKYASYGKCTCGPNEGCSNCPR